MYWDKGLVGAPEIVQVCVRSWKLRNSEYEVRVLDDSTVGAWVDLPALVPNIRDLRIQHRSDLLRLELLRVHGGIWADATVYCAIPLREWFPAELPEGFLALASRKRNRFLRNWFIAANPGAHFIDRWQSKYVEFLGSPLRHRPSAIERELFRLIETYVCRTPRSTGFWLTELPRRLLRTYPYAIHMYLANEVILHDPASAEAWARRPFITAAAKLLSGKHRADDTSRAMHSLRSKASPMYKLTWKTDLYRELLGPLSRMLDDIEPAPDRAPVTSDAVTSDAVTSASRPA